MNERIRELYNQTRNEISIRDGVLTPGAIRDEFAELIVQECASLARQKAKIIKTKTETYSVDSGEMSVGLSVAWQFEVFAQELEEHFGVEEQTPSQRMAAAGYTRRPKGWTKEDEE